MTFLKHPLLFERASDDTTTLGLGYMTGILSGTITRDRNAIPTLAMSYLEDDYLAPEIKTGRIILADGGPRFLRQKFRITKLEHTIDQDGLKSLSIEGTHVIGDLNYNVITGDISYANIDPKGAFDAVNKLLADPIPQLSFTSDILKVANIAWYHKDLDTVTDILLGEDQMGDQTNSMEAIYGGEYAFDNYHVTFDQQVGRDTGLVIKYGRNLQTLQQDQEIENTYTAVRPYATYTPETEPDDTDNSQYIKAFSGVGVVQWVGAGGVDLYDSPFKKHKLLPKKLTNGDYYKIFHVAEENTVNGDVWYDLGGDQWIDAHFFTLDKVGAFSYNKVTGQGTITPDVDTRETRETIVDFDAVATITYLGDKAVTIWDSPFDSKQPTGKYLANGGFWRVYRKATDGDSHVWYDLGGDQWVDMTYITFDKNGDYAVTNTRGLTQIKADDDGYNTPVYNQPGAGKVKTGKWLLPGERYQIFAQATFEGETWYKVGSGEWIDAKTCLFDIEGTYEPQDQETDTDATPVGKVPVWDGPGIGHSKTGKILSTGEQYKILGQADANGETWYKVGGSEWVKGDYLSFDGATDVIPQGDVQPTTEDEDDMTDEEVTITLPEQIIKADKADNYERLRIVNFDASSYGVTDVERLRKVTQAYIKDYRIGYPTVALTIAYQQMTGELAGLTAIDLCDIATIFYQDIDLVEKAECTEIIWNLVTSTPDSISFGERPMTLTHLLKDFETDINTKSSSHVSGVEQGLHDEINEAFKKSGADLDAAVLNIGKKIGVQTGLIQDQARVLDNLKTGLQTQLETVKNISDWIDSGSAGGIITAYPDWKNPTELRARSDAGGYMKFNSHGLGYYSSSGLIRSAIDSQGRIAAENISGVLGQFVKIKSVDIEGTSYIYLSDGTDHTELSYYHGLSTTQDIAAEGNMRIDGGATFNGAMYASNALYISADYGIRILNMGGNASIYYQDGEWKIWDGKHGNYTLYDSHVV